LNINMKIVRRKVCFASLVLLILGSAAVALGCGSNSDAAGDERPLTKAQFIDKAEAICRQGVAEKEKAFSAGLESGKTLQEASPAEVKRFIEDLAVEPYSKIAAHLAQLHVAKENEVAAALVREYEKAVKKLEADPVGALKVNPFLKADKAADDYGLKSCGL
jgi:hypothetical protein